MRETDSFYDIFFIYHPDDIDFLRRAAAQLGALGVQCRLDETVLSKSGVDIQRLQSDLLRSYTVGIVLSPSSATSQLCNELIQHGVNHSKRLITLVLDEDIDSEVHPAIAENPFVFFREQDNFPERVEELRRYLIVDQDTKLHTDYLVAADRWQRRARSPDLLLPAECIEEARSWLAAAGVRRPKPSPLQVEYIHSSRRQSPAKVRPLTSYLGLAAIVIILGAVGIALLGAAISAYQTAQAAAAQTSAAQQQIALTAAAATAASDSALGLLDEIAATSVRIAESVNLTEQAQAAAARQASRATQTAQFAADLRATQARATQIYDEARAEGAQRLVHGAEVSLAAGDMEMALALAWEATDRLEDPLPAIRLLRRATETRNTLTINDVAILRLQPQGDRFVLARESSASIQIYSARSWALLQEATDHAERVTAAAYSRDGKHLITGAADGEVVIRAGDTGAPLQRLRRHEGAVSALASHPAQNLLVSAGAEPMLVAWRLDTGEALAVYDGENSGAGTISELTISADGGRVIGWSRQGSETTVRQWSAESLELLDVGPEPPVYRGTDDQGRIAYTGGRSLPAYPGDPNTGDLVFWDLDEGEEITRLTDGFNWSLLGSGDLTAATDELRYISFKAEDALLLVRRSDGAQRVILVDIHDGVVLLSRESETIDRLVTAAFLNDGTILSASDDNRLLRWSLEDEDAIQEIGSAPGALAQVEVSAAGGAVLGRSAAGAVYLWRLNPSAIKPLLTQADAGPGTGLSPSGQNLILVQDSGVSLWDIDAGASKAQIGAGQIKLAGSTLARLAEDGVTVYDAESGESLRNWTGAWESDIEIFPAAEGETVILADGDSLWLLQSGSEDAQRLSAGGLGAPTAVSFTPDGERFLTLHREYAILWESASGEALGAYPLGPAPGSELKTAFSPNGDSLYFYVQLQDALAGLTAIELEDNRFRRHTFIDAAHGEFTSDGQYLLLVRADGGLLIIETESGAPAHHLAGIGPAARKLAYLPQPGLLIAAVGLELQVWDVASGQLDQRFSHRHSLLDFSYSLDGRRLLTLDSSATARLWQVETAEESLARIAAAAQPRQLSCAEREQYLVVPLCE